MSKISLDQLMEGYKDKNLSVERKRLIEKWSRTGLLRGLSEASRSNMAQMLENQTAQLLRESAALGTGGALGVSSGQIQGFTSIALPLVRRVFGGLVSNELVSIQALSMPSGLIFYLDYTYGSNVGGDAGVNLSSGASNPTYKRGQSLYTNPSGKGIQSGSLTAGGMYDLVGSGYSRVHSGSGLMSASTVNVGAFNGASEAFSVGATVSVVGQFTGTNARFANYDPKIETDLSTNTLDFCFVHLAVSEFTSKIARGDLLAIDQIAISSFATANGATAWGDSYQAGANVLNLRKLNKRGDFDGTSFTPNALNGSHIQFVVRLSNGGSVPVVGATTTVTMAQADQLQVDSTSGATLVVPSFETDFGSTPSPVIPDIDIKIESISITTKTRKLRARWTPELAQDLNAYQAVDAEVELTQILSQQIALEIDREILNELLTQANAARLYWSRAPGVFLNKQTGAPINLSSTLAIGPQFTGNVQEWYQTLVETINDVANTIYTKTLRGAGNFIVTSPQMCTILEHTTQYRAAVNFDGEGQSPGQFIIGAEKVGSLSNRMTVYKDPYFPTNQILVGYKGSNLWDAGYAYCPYVPLIVTPTIYDPNDLTPRRGAMTRYGSKMIRSDFYGTVSVINANVI